MDLLRRIALVIAVLLVGTIQALPKNEQIVKDQVSRLLKSIPGGRGAIVVLDQKELAPKAEPGEPTEIQKLVERAAAESGGFKVIGREAVVGALRADAGVQQRALIDPNAKPSRIGKALGADYVLISTSKSGTAGLRLVRAADESEIAAASFHVEPGSKPGEADRGEPSGVCGSAASYEGWACAPDAGAAKRGEGPGCFCKPESPKDFLYVRFTATASTIAVHSGRVAGMQSTCREDALKISQKESRRILTEYLKGTGLSNAEAVTKDLSGGFPNRPAAQLVECCALNPKTGRCADRKLREAETWETCQCTAVFRYPGGQPAFDAAVESASKKKP